MMVTNSTIAGLLRPCEKTRAAFYDVALIIVGFALPNSYTGLVSSNSAFLSPAASINISACSNASVLGAVSGDILTMNVSEIFANTPSCINIDVANVTLDCRGNTIRGNTSFTGVELRADGTAVHNCTFFNFSS